APIVFDGVRKQACAASILKVAMKNPDLSHRPNPGECPSSSNETDYGERCTFLVKPYRFSDISDDYYHLRDLTSTPEMRRNIAIVIRQMYFYCDLITKTNPLVGTASRKGNLPRYHHPKLQRHPGD
ncbi:MAG: hypothetical protein PUI76_03585, partial [Mollicutes bacterium]|nr:hypothetical protein [Mollicutes bacterium]